MSVPGLRGPAPQTPGARQKTITELLTQWADLTNAAIAATGDTEGWKDGTPLETSSTWDPAAENVALAPCTTRGSVTAHQLASTVYHAAFEQDPHPIADKLTSYWRSQGFTVERTVDWTDPSSGDIDVSVRAERADGVFYGLGVTKTTIAIDVSTECSNDRSIDQWVEKRLQQRFDQLHSTSPTPSPSAESG